MTATTGEKAATPGKRTRVAWRYVAGLLQGAALGGGLAVLAAFGLWAWFERDCYRLGINVWRQLLDGILLLAALCIPLGGWVQRRPALPALATRKAALWSAVAAAIAAAAGAAAWLTVSFRIEMWWMLEDVP